MNKPIKQKEGDIKKAIFSWLKLQPHTFVWINHTTGVPIGHTGKFRFNFNRGIADICGVKGSINPTVSGRAFAFEVKTPSGKLSPNQKDWLERFDRAGGYACVVRSLEDAIQAFSEV